MSASGFTADERVIELAERHASVLVDLAARGGMSLDFTDASVQVVEQLAGQLEDSGPKDWETNEASAEYLWDFAKMLGFYVGEVMRRHHGGEWGFMEQAKGPPIYGIRVNGGLTSPMEKAYQRLTIGPEDNLWSYYVMITRGVWRSKKPSSVREGPNVDPPAGQS